MTANYSKVCHVMSTAHWHKTKQYNYMESMEKLSRLECPNDIWQIFIVLYKEECRLKLETLTEPV